MKNSVSLRGLAAGLLLLAAGISVSLAGCGEKCDPGYHIEESICYVDVAAAAGAAGAAGAPAAPSCDDPSIETFGAVCYSDADCVCDSDFCAGYPGQAGICTLRGCGTDPSICPSGYSCMDLSTFVAGLSICVN